MNKKRKEENVLFSSKVGCFMGKKLIAAAVFMLAALTSGFCGNFSFQIVQKDESLTDVCESTLVIEDEILNYFFDQGEIVSNVPAAVSNDDAQDEKFYTDSYNEAVDGTVDKFCFIKLFFTGGGQENQKPSIGTLKKISWKLVSVKTGKVIEESSSAVKKEITETDNANVREFAADFANHLKKVMSSR